MLTEQKTCAAMIRAPQTSGSTLIVTEKAPDGFAFAFAPMLYGLAVNQLLPLGFEGDHHRARTSDHAVADADVQGAYSFRIIFNSNLRFVEDVSHVSSHDWQRKKAKAMHSNT